MDHADRVVYDAVCSVSLAMLHHLPDDLEGNRQSALDSGGDRIAGGLRMSMLRAGRDDRTAVDVIRRFLFPFLRRQ